MRWRRHLACPDNGRAGGFGIYVTAKSRRDAGATESGLSIISVPAENLVAVITNLSSRAGTGLGRDSAWRWRKDHAGGLDGSA